MDAKRISPVVLLICVGLLLVPPGMAQDTALPSSTLLPDMLVEFHFTNRDITDVMHHLAHIMGWSVFFDPTQMRGKVTIITPGKVSLLHAVRLLQGVTQPYAQAIQGLTPHSPQPVPLATMLEALARPTAQCDVVVWRNSNARGPQSRPYPCDQHSTPSPLLPFGMNVIVDQRR